MKHITTPKAIIFILVFVSAFIIYAYAQKNETKIPNNPFIDYPQGKSSLPLDEMNERPKLLKFGMYVTPDPNQNPISPPERFTGYHTGLDIEILPEEKDSTVAVKTMCSGNILHMGVVNGYGGVVIQKCTIDNQEVSVLYGHLNPDSIKLSINEFVTQAATIGELGKSYSSETGYTRKHLHLGIHKGEHMEFLGYVLEPSELQEFIDPLPIIERIGNT